MKAKRSKVNVVGTGTSNAFSQAMQEPNLAILIHIPICIRGQKVSGAWSYTGKAANIQADLHDGIVWVDLQSLLGGHV